MIEDSQLEPKNSSPLVYIPEGSKINDTNELMEPPELTYEKRKQTFHREEVKGVNNDRDVDAS